MLSIGKAFVLTGRWRYDLAKSKPTDKYWYIKTVSNKLNNAKVLKAIVKAFKQQYHKTSGKMSRLTSERVARSHPL